MSQAPHGDITVLAPNGAPLTEDFRPHDTVGKTLDQAVREFGREKQLDPSLPYVLVLGTTPLENALTLEQAGVRPGDTLKVRSKSIPGDGDASGAV